MPNPNGQVIFEGSLRPGQELPLHEVIAKNYGADHANRIHSDEGAANYGFAGALVPGVGLYAYMTRPVVEMLGIEWIEKGSMKAKFIQPVYHNERVSVRAKVASVDPIELNLELRNASNTVCALGSAGLPGTATTPDPHNYPFCPLPETDRRLAATTASFSVGEPLGSLELEEMESKFLDDVVETLAIYRGAESVCHPAFFIAQANEILMRNVALGPWIHTASEIQHCSIARDGERLSLRGRVIDLYEKRGNEYVECDLVILGDRPVARIRHTAIIKLRRLEE